MSPDAKLTALLEAYRQAEPNRYRGGIVALTGFQYQVWSYLADFAQALVSNNLLAGGQAFTEAFEALSDYTRAGETGTICVQVKHRLDRRRMSDAAAEFASIDRFLTSYNRGALRHGVIYEVVARDGDPSLNWDDVRLPAEVRAREPDLPDHFEEIRRAGRLRPPRFEPDPSWKFIATVFGQVTDPFGLARRSLERCLQRSTAVESAAYIRNAIAEDYTANIQRGQVFSQSLRPSDFEPDLNGSAPSIAKTPTLLDLRTGRFMTRQQRIGEVLATLDDLLDSSTGSGEPAVPVLWIDGRSGSGKSVLLLQVMRHLVIDRGASVVWLTRAEELGRLVEHLAVTDDILQPDFVFVDDIYDPQARDDLDVPRMTRKIVHSGLMKWPVLITCGPTEFRQDFERDCRAEGFRVVPWHLGTLIPSETAALRTWFESRTGTAPVSGRAQAEERALIISVIFEMVHGDLRPFALRFRARLVEDQIEDALTIPLALNRLYIWSPRNWLSVSEQARIERINQDGDFSFLSIEGSERGLLKLTHPHLSDAIYRALHPQTAPFTFAHHLITAFTKALTSHLPTADRLLRAIASNPERLEIADHGELVRGFTLAWSDCDTSRLSRVLSAEMWVSWTKWAARQASIANLLGTTPLDKAIELLATDHPRWPSLWLQLSQTTPGDPRLEKIAQAWLSTHFSDASWSHVWCTATQRFLQGSLSADDPMLLLPLGWQWLQTSLLNTGWSFVWERLSEIRRVDGFPVDPDAFAGKGAEWCAANPEAKDWNFVWQEIATVAGPNTPSISQIQIHQVGLEWLREHYDHPGWPFVWEDLLAASKDHATVSRPELVRIVHSWRTDRENDIAWSFLAAKLTIQELGTAKVNLEPSVVWVEQHRDHPKWRSVWTYLFEVRKSLLHDDQRWRLFKSACQWLADDDERDKAISVVRHLMVNLSMFPDSSDKPGLLTTAQHVLNRSVGEDEPEWPDAWFASLNREQKRVTADVDHALQTLRDLGKQWLAVSAHITHRAWSQVFRRLCNFGLSREAWARNLAFTAICRGFAPDSEAASLAARLLEDEAADEPPEDFLNWLDHWFTRRADKIYGFSVWFRLDRSARQRLQCTPTEQWAKLQRILDVHRPEKASQWERVVEHYVQRRPIRGRITKTARNKGGTKRPARTGYIVDIGVNAYLPMKEANIDPGVDAEIRSLIGRVFDFEIIRLDQEHLQVDVSRRTLPTTRQEVSGE
jgi:hypothetical protein